jgi:hypothetical protein
VARSNNQSLSLSADQQIAKDWFQDRLGQGPAEINFAAIGTQAVHKPLRTGEEWAIMDVTLLDHRYDLSQFSQPAFEA